MRRTDNCGDRVDSTLAFAKVQAPSNHGCTSAMFTLLRPFCRISIALALPNVGCTVILWCQIPP
jgi:hypothetical protein